MDNILLKEIPYVNRLLLEKAARDSGFDIPKGGELLHFRCTDSSAEVVLGMDEKQHSVAAFKSIPGHPPMQSEEIVSPRLQNNNIFESFRWYKFSSMMALESALRVHYMESRSLRVDRYTSEIYFESTEKEVLAEIRTKQGIFREKLMEYWKGKCAVTGMENPALLRASHIKPWAVSTNEERLDVYNGLLLNAMADAAFDRGLISFKNDGGVVFSQTLSVRDRKFIESFTGPIKLAEWHVSYMEFHRKTVFLRL
jgi:hypothetical protein